MPTPLSASALLEQEFLTLRAKLLEAAAVLDRLDRAEGDVSQDPRMNRVHEALAALRQPGADRAERLQLLFSLPYEKGWKERFFG